MVLNTKGMMVTRGQGHVLLVRLTLGTKVNLGIADY